MTDTECVFCDMHNIDQQGILFQDEFCYVVLNKYPNTYGHTLVVPREHFKDMLSTTDRALTDMFIVARRVAQRMEEKLKPTGIKLVCNSAGAEEIAHMHVHVIPLYNDSHKSLFPGFLKNNQITPEERSRLVSLLKLAK
jgi:histidine triad (HIT) family protein